MPGQITPAAKMRSDLEGTWLLDSFWTEKRSPSSTGVETDYPMGKNAKGVLIYSNDGHVSLQIMTPGAQTWASNDPVTGTTEEKADAMNHYLAYTGRYSVKTDEKGAATVYHSIDCCLFPGWLGGTQERTCRVEGGSLFLLSEPTNDQGALVQPLMKWRKP